MPQRIILSCLLLSLFAMSCQDENMEPVVPDTMPPAFVSLRLNLEDVQDGETVELSLSEGWRLDFILEDEDLITLVDAYFLVNDDPDLRADIASGIIIDSERWGIGYVYAIDRLPLGNGNFYDFEEGDILHFYIRVGDASGNEQQVAFQGEMVP